MTNELGRLFVNFYYKYSPLAADLIARHKALKLFTRLCLFPVVAFSYSMLYFGHAIVKVMFIFIFAFPFVLVLFYMKK